MTRRTGGDNGDERRGEEVGSRPVTWAGAERTEERLRRPLFGPTAAIAARSRRLPLTSTLPNKASGLCRSPYGLALSPRLPEPLVSSTAS